VPNSNISIRWVSQTDLPDRPDTDTFELNILPAGIQTGTANIAVTVTDAVNQKTTVIFKLTVTPSLVFAYEKPISIPLGAPIAGEASPYPALIPVSGIEGLAHKVSLSLPGFSHTFPSDLSVLLVDPAGGKSVMLLSHAGADADANNIRLTFSDAGTTLAQTDPLVSGTVKPAQFGTAIKLPPPAPQGTYDNALSAFSGSEPNGDWKLFVYDEAFPDGGDIAGGAMLFIETKPAFKSIAQRTTPENVPILVPISIFNSTVHPSNLVVTATSEAWNSGSGADNTALNPTFGYEGFGGNRFLWITNAADQPSKTVFGSPRSMTNQIANRGEGARSDFRRGEYHQIQAGGYLCEPGPTDYQQPG
jgi:hypothetical protein